MPETAAVPVAQIEMRHGFAVLKVLGDLDCASAARFRQDVADLLRHPAVAVDLAAVPFIDSAGLGALIGGVRRIREAGGVAAVCGARPSVARVLGMTGFDRIAKLHPTVREAASELLRPASGAH